MASSQHITRLAPSPTGALHLGNLRTFVVNYLMARRMGWQVLMRVEDLDGPRVKAGSAEQMLDELRWLGLSWDGPVVYQSQRAGAYGDALRQLMSTGAAYACACSRKDIETAGGAPHLEDGAAIYAGTCRGRFASPQQCLAATGRAAAMRVLVEDCDIEFADQFAGPQRFNLARTSGDFVIHKNDGLAAYQLAVVVDDAAAGVTAIVRGEDLLESAARQMHLRRLLGLAGEPLYWHLPLVIGPDGRRLAKRHGDTRLACYRLRGATPQRVLGLLGYWCGLFDRRRETSMDELLAAFDISLLPRGPVVFSAADDAFLAD